MNITTWDSVLTDVCVPVKSGGVEEEKFRRFLKANDIAFDNKTYISAGAFQEIFGKYFIENTSGTGPLITGTDQLLEMTGGSQPVVGTGGSIPNLGATYIQLMGQDNAQFNLVTITAADHYGRANRNYLEKSGITLWPSNLPSELVPQRSSISIAFILDLVTTYAVFDGGAKAVMRPEYVTKDMVNKSDMVIMPGSSVRKFGPEFVKHTIALQKARNNFRIYVLPSGERAARKYSAFSDQAMRCADGTIGNYVEVGVTILPPEKSKHIKHIHPDEIAEEIRKRLNMPHQIVGRDLWKGVPFALMSKGGLGACVILPDRIIAEPAAVPSQFNSTGGCGDNLAGTFLAFLTANTSWRNALKGALHGAAAKIETTITASQENPKGNIRRRDSSLISLLDAGIAQRRAMGHYRPYSAITGLAPA